MTYAAIIGGLALVTLTLVDTFFTVLNYNQRGLLVNRAIAAEWRLTHWLFRPLSVKIRRRVYRSMTGLTLLSGILLWAAGIVLGFALVFFGAIAQGALTVSADAPGGFVGAFYYSLGQFSTVGADGLTAVAAWVSVLSVIETALCVLLLSLVVAFLVNVFSSIEALRTLCACFPSSTPHVSSPIAPLAPYLPRRDPASLENHLATTRQAMNSYFDSIAADHSAIYFYSGKDRFVMPFAVFMLAGTLECLGSGFPAEHPISSLPELVRLEEAYQGNCEQMYDLFRWEAPTAPEPLGKADFVGAATALTQASDGPSQQILTKKPDTDNYYVERFVSLRQTMANLGGFETPGNWATEYAAYCDWLNVVYLSDDFIARSSRLFDYRPQYEPDQYSYLVAWQKYGWKAPQVNP